MFPTVGTRFGEFFAPMVRLRTVIAMMLDGFVEFVVGVGSTLLAILIGAQGTGAGQEQRSEKGGGSENGVNEFHARPPVIHLVQLSTPDEIGPVRFTFGKEQGQCHAGSIAGSRVSKSCRTKKLQ